MTRAHDAGTNSADPFHAATNVSLVKNLFTYLLHFSTISTDMLTVILWFK